ncbi:Transcriptional repressor CTCFL [Orchesella cincta]|uniref:Transcriptional repressor CTCFL n=1 Tax=Orchesella cincta TaxID=48709 RepID=A0A1D2M835_ORCCI|nr:Transcriptional repressor CTCFL [Orchesella cincta]
MDYLEEVDEEKIEVRVDSCLICAQVAATYDLQGNLIKREREDEGDDQVRKWCREQLFTFLCRGLEIRQKKLYSPLLQLESVCETCEGLLNSLAEVYSKLEELQTVLKSKIVEAEKTFERERLYEKHCSAYRKFRKDALEACHKGTNGKQSWTATKTRKERISKKIAEETIVPDNDSSHDDEEELPITPPPLEPEPLSPTRMLRKRRSNVGDQQNESSSDSNPSNVEQDKEAFIPSDVEHDLGNDDDDDYVVEKRKKRKYTKRKKITSSSTEQDEAVGIPKNQPKGKSLFQAAHSIPSKCLDTVAVRVDLTTKRTAQLKRTIPPKSNRGYVERNPATGSITYTTGYGNRFRSFRTTLNFNRIKGVDGKMGYECTTCSETIPLLKRGRKQESLFRQHYLTSHSQRYSCRLCPETPIAPIGRDCSSIWRRLTQSRPWSATKMSSKTAKNRNIRTVNTHMNDEEKKEALLLDTPRYKQLSSIPASSSTSGSINICESCGMFITNGESGMRHHIQDSHPELEEPSVKPFLCTICGVSLSSIASLEHHTRKKHPDGEIDHPFKCKFPSCPASLSDEPSLKNHVEVEHGQSEEARNGVLCLTCGRVLSATCGLKTHGLVHSRERAHKCHLCPKTFPLKPTLKLHLAAKHGIGAEMIKCEVAGCLKLFSNKTYFRCHMRTVHGEVVNKRKCN